MKLCDFVAILESLKCPKKCHTYLIKDNCELATCDHDGEIITRTRAPEEDYGHECEEIPQNEIGKCIDWGAFFYFYFFVCIFCD